MSQGKDFQKLHLRLRKGFFILASILKSFHSAAYYVLWLKFLQILFLPLDVLIRLYEKIFLKNLPVEDDIPVIFVVGIQRTGSTLVSQVVEQAFPFAPLGNLCTIFKRSEYVIHKWMKRFYKRKKTPDFKNFYGISKGIFTIGDSYEVWDKWLGNNHYVIPRHIPEKKTRQMQRYFSNLHKAYKRPVLTKNNRNSLMINYFSKIFPNAFFIVVNRNPVKVIRSTLQASCDYFGKGDYLWGLVPNESFTVSNYENIVEAATVQYLELEKLLKEQLKNIPVEQYLEIDYDDFCDHPEKTQQKLNDVLQKKYDFNQKEINYISLPFRKSKRLDNNNRDKAIKQYLEKYGNN